MVFQAARSVRTPSLERQAIRVGDAYPDRLLGHHLRGPEEGFGVLSVEQEPVGFRRLDLSFLRRRQDGGRQAEHTIHMTVLLA